MDKPLEPANKRLRLSPDDFSELELQIRRERNDQRLKSHFEAIYEKYGQDFEDVGDEIDLESGQIVVNNGHIFGMEDDRDVGLDTSSESDETSEGEDSLQQSMLSHIQQRIRALVPEKDLDSRSNRAKLFQTKASILLRESDHTNPVKCPSQVAPMPKRTRTSSGKGVLVSDRVVARGVVRERSPETARDEKYAKTVVQQTTSPHAYRYNYNSADGDGTYRIDNSTSEPTGAQSLPHWTEEENCLLKHLMLSTTLSPEAISNRYFPHRSIASMILQWKTIHPADKELAVSGSQAMLQATERGMPLDSALSNASISEVTESRVGLQQESSVSAKGAPNPHISETVANGVPPATAIPKQDTETASRQGVSRVVQANNEEPLAEDATQVRPSSFVPRPLSVLLASDESEDELSMATEANRAVKPRLQQRTRPRLSEITVKSLKTNK